MSVVHVCISAVPLPYPHRHNTSRLQPSVFVISAGTMPAEFETDTLAAAQVIAMSASGPRLLPQMQPTPQPLIPRVRGVTRGEVFVGLDSTEEGFRESCKDGFRPKGSSTSLNNPGFARPGPLQTGSGSSTTPKRSLGPTSMMPCSLLNPTSKVWRRSSLMANSLPRCCPMLFHSTRKIVREGSD